MEQNEPIYLASDYQNITDGSGWPMARIWPVARIWPMARIWPVAQMS